MPGIDQTVAVHRLYVDPTISPIKKKKRLFNDKKDIAIGEEVQTLLKEQAGVLCGRHASQKQDIGGSL
ncbi:hypothetical protein LIER_35709 [Lithospermum erythrorhizon]|uniref:Uncharacterized protein n=1 Tax=Lithospermum erythrorhizon TaxID=34254 RepID=A0AAV3NZV4_LITER